MPAGPADFAGAVAGAVEHAPPSARTQRRASALSGHLRGRRRGAVRARSIGCAAIVRTGGVERAHRSWAVAGGQSGNLSGAVAGTAHHRSEPRCPARAAGAHERPGVAQADRRLVGPGHWHRPSIDRGPAAAPAAIGAGNPSGQSTGPRSIPVGDGALSRARQGLPRGHSQYHRRYQPQDRERIAAPERKTPSHARRKHQRRDLFHQQPHGAELRQPFGADGAGLRRGLGDAERLAGHAGQSCTADGYQRAADPGPPGAACAGRAGGPAQRPQDSGVHVRLPAQRRPQDSHRAAPGVDLGHPGDFRRHSGRGSRRQPAASRRKGPAHGRHGVRAFDVGDSDHRSGGLHRAGQRGLQPRQRLCRGPGAGPVAEHVDRG